MEKTTGKRDPRLDVEYPDWPIMSIWRDLSGVELTYSELKAYCELTGTELDPWEIKVLMMMNSTAKKVIEGIYG